MTIAQALAAADGTQVIVSGTVTVAEDWSEQYNNMSVTISDGTDTLYIFRLATQVKVNDIITVTGKMGTYNGSRQIAQGATAVITGTHEHTYVEGTCSGCGAKEQTASQATISFANKEQRTVFTTSQQVWVQNGITVTNDKAASTSNVADYANPARFYKSSKLTIAYTSNMTKIEVTCDSSSYATELTNSVGGAASKNGSVVTITLETPATTFVIAKLSAQVRVRSIVVYA